MFSTVLPAHKMLCVGLKISAPPKGRIHPHSSKHGSSAHMAYISYLLHYLILPSLQEGMDRKSEIEVQVQGQQHPIGAAFCKTDSSQIKKGFDFLTPGRWNIKKNVVSKSAIDKRNGEFLALCKSWSINKIKLKDDDSLYIIKVFIKRGRIIVSLRHFNEAMTDYLLSVVL